MTIKEKVAYLRGLAEGIGIGTESNVDKILIAVIDTLEDIATEIDELSENAIDIGEEIDSLADDLSDLEEMLCGEDYNDFDNFDPFDDDDDDDDDGECSCGHCHGDDEDISYEVLCPACGVEIALDEDDLLKGSINCFVCGELLEFDFDDDDDDDDEAEEDKED